MLEKVKELVTTLTEESQKSILDKCDELKFDINRGLLPLDVSFKNLNHLSSVLIGAENKFNILPPKIQDTLLKSLQQISTHQSKLMDGEDQVQNIVNSIEALNALVWQCRIQDLSDKETIYHEKINRLKEQEKEADEL